ncbi:MAG: rRNA pseudouridine synthase [Fibrobacterota bacterium]|nr:rRNA pseudouridine synthase [Fibrobacterota bacterium]
MAQSKRTHLNRALSKLGLCSRGIAERWIEEGRVSVNGERADSPEQWVDLENDRIEVTPESAGTASGVPEPESMPQGEAAAVAVAGTVPPRESVYLALHKPAGFVTTRSDELGRKTVYDLLPESQAGGWLFPVGRLDKDSEGLLLMTNDGEWANLLTDPEFHVEKTYRVKLDGKPMEEEMQRFRTGIELDGSRTLPAKVEPEGAGWYRVVLTEGRNRQIRRMFHALGYKVKRLVRVSIDALELGDLAEGASVALDSERVDALRKAANRKG